MRILIIGSDANACTIAKKLVKNPGVGIIFITTCVDSFSDVNLIQKIDIAENDNEELLDFAIANEISLTIVTSFSAIKNNIAEYFNDARQQIFAPMAQSASIAIYRSIAKKTMYKFQIPTMKFGIFERENQAIDYISCARKPLVIKNDINISGDYPVFASTFKQSKNAIEHFFTFPDNKIIIEDWIDAKEVTMYFITDGYTALPIGTVSPVEKYNSKSDVYSPDKYISDELEIKIIKEVVYPILDELAERSTPYCGILGIDILVQNDTYNVIEFIPFFKHIHLQAILPLIKTDILDLFLSAACGSLSDEYNCVNFNNLSTYSKICPKVNLDISKILEDDNLLYTNTSKNTILTEKAVTIGKAKNKLFENIEYLKDCGAAK